MKLDLGFNGTLNSDVRNVDNSIMTNVEALTIVWQYCTTGERSINDKVTAAMNSLHLTLDSDDYDALKQLYDLAYNLQTHSIDTDAAIELSQQSYFLLTHKYNHLENEELNDPNHPDPSSIPLPNSNPASLNESFWRSNCNIEGQKALMAQTIKNRVYYKSGLRNKEIQDYNADLLLQYN